MAWWGLVAAPATSTARRRSGGLLLRGCYCGSYRLKLAGGGAVAVQREVTVSCHPPASGALQVFGIAQQQRGSAGERRQSGRCGALRRYHSPGSALWRTIPTWPRSGAAVARQDRSGRNQSLSVARWRRGAACRAARRWRDQRGLLSRRAPGTRFQLDRCQRSREQCPQGFATDRYPAGRGRSGGTGNRLGVGQRCRLRTGCRRPLGERTSVPARHTPIPAGNDTRPTAQPFGKPLTYAGFGDRPAQEAGRAGAGQKSYPQGEGDLPRSGRHGSRSNFSLTCTSDSGRRCCCRRLLPAQSTELDSGYL